MANINWVAVGLLVVSNFIMLVAWYGHLQSMSAKPVWLAVIVSWLIALAEYAFMIPANRMGAKTMSLEQLKIVQEAIALVTFVPFSLWMMKTPLSWNYAAAALCVFAAVFFVFCKPLP